MTNYAQHFSTRATPQTEQSDPRQVANSAGGYSFPVDDRTRLRRFLILGNEGGSYYAGERKLTIENAKCVQRCLDKDPEGTVDTIAGVSTAGQAPKNDPAIFALAIAAGHPKASRYALSKLGDVCRTGTHLFQFAGTVRSFRGWGRGLRRAVARWYDSKPVDKLSYQIAKYGQRGGWSHRDLLRLSHPTEHQAIYRYVAQGPAGVELPPFLDGFEQLKRCTDVRECVKLIEEHGFTHEMLPSELKRSPEVWAALLEKMPMGAMVRNLGVMTERGLLKPMSEASKTVAQRLRDVGRIKKARLHPVALLSALMVYQRGHGARGSLSWSPSPEVVDALDDAFYLSFDSVEPSGKNTMIALDVSGSMTWGEIAGVPGLTPRLGSAAMAMATLRAEPWTMTVGFSQGLTHIPLTKKQRLDDAVRMIERVPMGGTDCSLPMLVATQEKLDVDTFVIYTDSETYAGRMHPHQALEQYRQKSGRPAKLVVVGMLSNGFTIANPSDGGMLDVVGFDTSAPSVIADFAKG